jgi:hypothetical protein
MMALTARAILGVMGFQKTIDYDGDHKTEYDFLQRRNLREPT